MTRTRRRDAEARRRAGLWAAGAFAALLGRAAVAEAEPVTREAIAEDMHAYYRGERGTAYAFMVFSTLSLVAGAVLVTRDNDFARGLGWPAIAVGAIEILGGTGYLFQVNSSYKRASELLERDPVAYKRVELAQIRATSTRYTIYRSLELGLGILGAAAATYGFASKREFWAGLGVGLAIQAFTSFTIDSFGGNRTCRYENRLSAFAPGVSVSGGPGDRSVLVSLGGRF